MRGGVRIRWPPFRLLATAGTHPLPHPLNPSPQLPPPPAQAPRREAQLQLRALMAAWQRVLPEFFPQMAADTVEGGRQLNNACTAASASAAVCQASARHAILRDNAAGCRPVV